MERRIQLAALLVVAVMIAGCGISDTKLNDAQQRIDFLKAKGVPDSLITPASVCLYQLRDSKRISVQNRETGEAMRNLDAALSRAEAYYREQVSNLKQPLDSLQAIIRTARNYYVGVLRKKFDSLTAIADSFAGLGWTMQAYAHAHALAMDIPTFNAEVQRAKALQDSVPGTWECLEKDTNPENPAIKTIDRKVFSFDKNGSAKFIEARTGQSGPLLKEDWEFVSQGAWELYGDTVYLTINRFALVRQKFEHLYLEQDGKKKSWLRPTTRQLPMAARIDTSPTAILKPTSSGPDKLRPARADFCSRIASGKEKTFPEVTPFFCAAV